MNATQKTESDKIAVLHRYSIQSLVNKMIKTIIQRIPPQTLVVFVILCLLSSIALFGQTPPKKTESQQPMGGVSTGAPLNYTTRRTVGITDPKAPVIFEDVTDKTTLRNFRHRAGNPEKN